MSEPDCISQFNSWLINNGAKFPKIKWPSYETQTGIRGAIATQTIATNETMLEIPTKLMMWLPNFTNDPIVGPIILENKSILGGDLQLTVFIMCEMLKGKDSFYYPFLQIIPESDCIVEWNLIELAWLQDDDLSYRAKSRKLYIQNLYKSSVLKLVDKYPNIFKVSDYSYDLFRFAWHAIMARAFGKRLQYSAMVPLADCLNHANVQTKYDCNFDGNGVFRLFPTGKNFYSAGSEIFNSYGRRRNDNLLLEYGFAMLDNEWELLLLDSPIVESYSFAQEKQSILFKLEIQLSRGLSIRRLEFPWEALLTCRILLAGEDELESLSSILSLQHSLECVQPHELQSRNSLATTIMEQQQRQQQQQKPIRKPNNYVISISLEKRVCEVLLKILNNYKLSHFSTTIEEDTNQLKILKSASNVPKGESCLSNNQINTNRMSCAITYRLTRKRVIQITIERLTALARALDHIGGSDTTILVRHAIIQRNCHYY